MSRVNEIWKYRKFRQRRLRSPGGSIEDFVLNLASLSESEATQYANELKRFKEKPIPCNYTFDVRNTGPLLKTMPKTMPRYFPRLPISIFQAIQIMPGVYRFRRPPTASQAGSQWGVPFHCIQTLAARINPPPHTSVSVACSLA